jgi:S1-C subfamily serine protease
MGFQRLLLAIALLTATRVFTFIAPLPPVKLDRGDLVILDRPALDRPALDKPDYLAESKPQIYQDDRNPVETWVGTSATANGCKSAGKAVVTVYAGREIGSGSIVSAAGLVITNNHVVRRLGKRGLSVTTLEGDRYDGRVIATDQRHDLALLQLTLPQTKTISLPAVPFSTVGTAEVGASVCAIGSPFGKAGMITQGSVINILPNGDLESDVVLKPGNSGGPLLNASGEMVGINKGVARSRGETGDRASYATPASVAKEFIAETDQTSLGQSRSRGRLERP